MTPDGSPATFPAGWAWTTLGNCVEILDGQRVPVNRKEREKRKGSTPYYGATGQVGWIDDYLFDEDLVLLGEDGVQFLDALKQKAYVIKGRSWVNNHAHVLRAIAGLMLNGYLLHYLNVFDYHGYVTGTTRLKLPQAPMCRMPVSLPPTNEQRRIVARIEKLFSKLDAGVAELKKAKAQLKRYRQAVLKAAFEGKLTEEWRKAHPEVEPASVLLERIREERRKKLGKKYKEPPPLDTSALPELPKGWAWAALQAVLMNHDGRRIPVSRKIRSSRHGRYPYYGASGVVDSIDDFIFEGEHLLIGEDGANLLARATPIAFRVHGRFWVNNHAHVFTGYAGSPLAYFEHYINGIDLAPFVTGTAQPKLPQRSMNKIPVPVAPIEEQTRLAAEVDRLLTIADKTSETVQGGRSTTLRLRQSILKRAFEGKLVPQDPSDEPAEQLLERIRAEKTKRATERKATRRTKRKRRK